MKYLDPTGEPTAPERSAAVTAKLGSIANRTLAVVNNGWQSMARIGERAAEQLRAEHGVREVRFYGIPRNRAAEEGVLARIREECDAAIVGLAN